MNRLSALLSPRRTALAILLALAASLTTHAQTIEMNPTNGPYGGTVVDVLLDRDGSLFAATAVGLFRSTDDGESWEMNAFEGINVRYLRRDSVGFIYAGTDSGLYRSGDWGARWSRYLGEYGVIHDLAFHGNGSRFFAIDEGSLYRSVDGGDTWNEVYFDQGWGFLHPTITTVGDSTLYVRDVWNLLRSTDNGETWCQTISAVTLSGISTGTAFPFGYFGAIDAFHPLHDGDSVLIGVADSTLIRAGCGHKDDDDIDDVLVTHSQPHYLSFIEGPEGSILAGTVSRGILRSMNRDTVWAPYIPATGEIYDMIYAGDGRLYAGVDARGVLRVPPGSTSGTYHNDGMTGMKLLSLSADSAGGMLAGTDGGVHRTTDGGRQWELVGLEEYDAGSIEVAPDGTIYVGTSNPGLLARSFDLGRTWETVSRGPMFSYESVAILEATDAGVIFSTSIGYNIFGCDMWFFPEVFRTDRESTDWVSVRSFTVQPVSMVRTPSSRLLASFDPVGASPPAPPTPTGLYISTDGGVTFTHSTALPPEHEYQLLASTDFTFYALSDDSTFYRSVNSGGEWAPVQTNLRIAALPVANKRGELYLLQNRTLYRSIDKGSFWEEIDDDLPTALAVTAVDRDGYLYAGGDALRVYRSSMTTVGVDDDDRVSGLSALSVAPNPSEGEAELRFHLEERGEVQIRVVDMKGKVHLEKRMMAEKGELLERLDLSTLPSGAYTVVVEQGKKRMEKRILVVR